jgi:hypothetical protein
MVVSPPTQLVLAEDDQKFFVSLYPNGISLDELVQLTSKAYGRDSLRTKKGIIKKIDSWPKYVEYVDMKKPNSRVTEVVIVLTDEGKRLVWQYAYSVRDSAAPNKGPREYLRMLKVWCKTNDPVAQQEYDAFLATAIGANFDLCNFLTHPRPKQEILTHAAKMRGADPANPDFQREIDTFLNTAITMDLLRRETQNLNLPDPEHAGYQCVPMEVFYLTPDGQSGVTMYNRRLRSGSIGQSGSHSKTVVGSPPPVGIGTTRQWIGFTLCAMCLYGACFLFGYSGILNWANAVTPVTVSTVGTSILYQPDCTSVVGVILAAGLIAVWFPFLASVLIRIALRSRTNALTQAMTSPTMIGPPAPSLRSRLSQLLHHAPSP